MYVLFFELSEEVMEARLLERGKTSGRVDDNKESIKKRFKTYEEQTLPIVKHFDGLGMVERIDAARSKDEVFGALTSEARRSEATATGDGSRSRGKEKRPRNLPCPPLLYELRSLSPHLALYLYLPLLPPSPPPPSISQGSVKELLAKIGDYPKKRSLIASYECSSKAALNEYYTTHAPKLRGSSEGKAFKAGLKLVRRVLPIVKKLP